MAVAFCEDCEKNVKFPHQHLDPGTLKDKLISVDNGRFKDLIESLDVKNICLKCITFNQTLVYDPDIEYRCAVPGKCIGATLRSELISYLLWKVDVKTEKEHMVWIGL